SFAPEPVATSRRTVPSGRRSPARGRRGFGARSGSPAASRPGTRAWVSAAVAARSRANTIARWARGERTRGKGRSLSARVRSGRRRPPVADAWPFAAASFRGRLKNGNSQVNAILWESKYVRNYSVTHDVTT